MGRPGVGNPGNKGGRRMGYEYEKDQILRLRKIVDRGIAKVEAIEKGKVGPKEVEKFKILMPFIIKSMDKLHANRQHLEHSGEVTSKIIKLDE